MRNWKLISVVIICSELIVARGAPLGTAFNYQGRLVEGGTPATGTYDFQFNVYAAAAGGAALTGVLTRNDVAVNAGLFLAELDFGSAPFMGEERWLEISVRPGASVGAYTLLAPRQRLNAMPYALYSLKTAAVPWSGLTGVPASFADGLDNDTTYTPGSGLTLAGTTFSLDTALLDARYWKLLGNGGTDPALNFLGTIDNQPLNIRVNNTRALRFEPNAAATPHLIGGYSGNIVDPGLVGAVIGGGGGGAGFQHVQGSFAFIGGGDRNIVGPYAFVGGGARNEATGYGSVVGGGAIPPGVAPLGQNIASATASTIGGGVSNSATATRASVLGGGSNTAGGIASTVGGGSANYAAADFSTVGGGTANWAIATNATSSGGVRNVASGISSTVSGGSLNTASGLSANVAGGTNNLAAGTNAVIGGGAYNTNTGLNSVIGGGFYNRALAIAGVVAGGSSNLASSATNVARGMAVGGGELNQSLGNWATVPGGWSNIASGDFSVAAGRRAKASHESTFVWADATDAEFVSTANNQFSIRANSGVRIQSTNIALDLRGGGALRVAGAGIGASTPVFIHRATGATISGNVTKIEHPLCNDDPNAILIVTPNWNPGGGALGTYNNHPIGVYYADPPTGRWHIFNQDSAAMPVGAAFNILIVKP